ncbi:AMP-binding protein [Aquimarina sp. 2201CG14-23]|uniref:AMP-binding protein n=1 Tax=Aquimarina mycalae TaxID=3040073 RepID=UPI002477ED1D|nr:AMP-binding protein [Aquimarina sp. 2201CG14-23]MDH7447447.1 AMP-binding protein [Aquimarina sp. 2201CG14-23]
MSSLRIPDYNSLPEYFYHWIDQKPDFPFLKQPKGNSWKILTYRDAYIEASKMTSALQKLGLKKGDHVAIYSKNCYHWILVDLAIMMGGFVSVPLYYNLSGKQLGQVLEQSDAKIVFVGKLDSWSGHVNEIKDTTQIIRFPHYEGNAKVTQGLLWDDLISQNEPLSKGYVPDPEELWTILFTSGTTGTPKGVMHVHKTPVNIIKNDDLNDWMGAANNLSPKLLSYLPLNHVGEKIGIYTSALTLGGTISFAESIETFAKNLQETQPTIFFAAPRIWTKFYLGVANKISLKKQKILFKIPILSGFLKKKIRQGLGMTNARLVVTGSAITPTYLKEWYKNLGIYLIEAYGMTEVCGSITNTPMRDAPTDSVGKPVPGCEIRIDPKTQEVLMKSPFMMKGYYKDSELTERVLKDGWLHSGDKGKVDEQGFLRIIGRVSDAFKTSKGKYITPNPMEEKIEKNVLVEQVCVAGLGLPQPIAVINLSEVALDVAKEEVELSLDDTLVSLNNDLANYERVSTIVVDRTAWNTENGLLTPTLKIRRGEIDNKFSENFLEWHNSEKKIIWL